MDVALPRALGELKLKPWEFYRMTPWEFFRMWDGYQARKSDMEEFWAGHVAFLANATGRLKNRVTPQEILGRPFRAHWKDAMDKKTTDRLAQKDAERRKRLQRME